MSQHRQISLAILLLLTALVGWSTPAHAERQVYESKRLPYSVEVPEGWRGVDPSQLPKARIDAMRETIAQSMSNEGAQEDAIDHVSIDVFFFGPQNDEGNMALAYVTGLDIEGMGVSGRSAIIGYFGGVSDALERSYDVREVDFTKGFPEVANGEVAVDTASPQFVVGVEEQDAKGVLEVATWAKVGKTRQVQISMATRPGVDATAAFQTFHDSFRLDPDEVATGAQDARDAYALGKKAAEYALPALGIVGLIIGVVAVIINKRKSRPR